MKTHKKPSPKRKDPRGRKAKHPASVSVQNPKKLKSKPATVKPGPKSHELDALTPPARPGSYGTLTREEGMLPFDWGKAYSAYFKQYTSEQAESLNIIYCYLYYEFSSLPQPAILQNKINAYAAGSVSQQKSTLSFLASSLKAHLDYPDNPEFEKSFKEAMVEHILNAFEYTRDLFHYVGAKAACAYPLQFKPGLPGAPRKVRSQLENRILGRAFLDAVLEARERGEAIVEEKLMARVATDYGRRVSRVRSAVELLDPEWRRRPEYIRFFLQNAQNRQGVEVMSRYAPDGSDFP